MSLPGWLGALLAGVVEEDDRERAEALTAFYQSQRGKFGKPNKGGGASDVIPPTVAITLSQYTFKAGETATVTFTFSEAPVGFTVADVTAQSGTLSSFSGSGISYTVTFTPSTNTEDATNVITVGTGWTDAAGNAPAGSTSSSNYTVDTLAPTVVITANAATITAAAFTATFTFSETVTGFTAADITVGNGSAAAVGGSGAVYTSVITPTATGTVTLDVAGGVCVDAAGNANTAAAQFSILYISALMWIKADLGTGGVNDGDIVTTWTDQSGNSNSPTQPGADSLKPLYKTNILNSLPVVRGDGSNDFLKKAFTLNQPYTVFLIFKLITEGFGKTVFDGNASSQALFDQTSTTLDTFRLYAGAELGITHPAIASFAIATFRVNGASSRISIGATRASGNAGAGNATGIEIFAKGDNSSSSNTDIAEMMIFSGAMSDATMNNVGAYLGTKWGLTWTNF